jgi:hypothetical protein
MIRGTTLVEARGLHSAAARPSIDSGWVRARPDYGGLNRPALSVLSVVSGPWSVALEQRTKDNRQYSFGGDSGDGFGAGLLVKLSLASTRWAPGATPTIPCRRRWILICAHDCSIPSHACQSDVRRIS